MFNISPIQLKLIISSTFSLGGLIAAGVLAAETGDPRYWALLSSIPVSACAVTFFSAAIDKCCGQRQNQVGPADGDDLKPDIKDLDGNVFVEVIVPPRSSTIVSAAVDAEIIAQDKKSKSSASGITSTSSSMFSSASKKSAEPQYDSTLILATNP